jgi:hypothetical protein
MCETSSVFSVKKKVTSGIAVDSEMVARRKKKEKDAAAEVAKRFACCAAIHLSSGLKCCALLFHAGIVVQDTESQRWVRLRAFGTVCIFTQVNALLVHLLAPPLPSPTQDFEEQSTSD